MEKRNKKIKRGDIYYAFLPESFGSVQKGTRPVVIVSNEFANEYSSVITVVPLTTSSKTNRLPTHVSIEPFEKLRLSIAMCEQITSISTEQLRDRVGHISETDMTKIDYGVIMQMFLKSKNATKAKVKLGRTNMIIDLTQGIEARDEQTNLTKRRQNDVLVGNRPY